jgi:hypothetical protein
MGSAGWDERGEVQLGTLSPGMPAEKSGLKKGDVVIAANGVSIRSQIKFHEIIPRQRGQAHRGATEARRTAHDGDGAAGVQQAGRSERWMIGAMVEPKFSHRHLGLSFPMLSRNRSGKTPRALSSSSSFSRAWWCRISPKHLTGPIGIAQLSGEARARALRRSSC